MENRYFIYGKQNYILKKCSNRKKRKIPEKKAVRLALIVKRY